MGIMEGKMESTILYGGYIGIVKRKWKPPYYNEMESTVVYTGVILG